MRDIPTTHPATGISFEQFHDREIRAPNMIPEAFYLVVANGEYVAMCDFVRDPGLPDALSGRMTGCLPAWRGKGIVTALKLQMARFAHEHGYREIRTWNSAANVSMVRINEGIGFVRQVTWVTFERSLDARHDGGSAVHGD
jgi:RimJ/RimL family protein N-acetyltransferase